MIDETSSSNEWDYYDVLGVERNATVEQIGSAYKALSIKYHPDRNPDDEGAAKAYKAVNEAYNCLSDPAKRVQYDIGGKAALAAPPTTAVEVTGMGTIGKALGVVMNKFGVQISSQVANEFVATAQAICRSGGLSNAPGMRTPVDGRVTDMVWGCPIDGKVERHFGTFYRLVVDEELAAAGFVLSLKSTHKDKFKIFVFSEEGNLVAQDDSIENRKGDANTALVVSSQFPISRVAFVPPAADSPVPALFYRLEGLTTSKKQIAPGNYLIAIYGDNIFGRSTYSYLLAKGLDDPARINKITSTDESLIESRHEFAQLKEEYLRTKAAYEATLQKMDMLDSKVNLLLNTREEAYKSYVKAAAQVSAPMVVGSEAAGNTIPALGATSDDGHVARRLSFTALTQSLHPNNIRETAVGVVDAASAGAKAVANSWWSVVRRPSVSASSSSAAETNEKSADSTLNISHAVVGVDIGQPVVADKAEASADASTEVPAIVTAPPSEEAAPSESVSSESMPTEATSAATEAESADDIIKA